MIPTLTLVGNIVAGISSVTGLLALCVRLWAWRKHQKDKAAHARRVRKATPEELPELEHTRPDPPPQLGGLVVLAVGGALASMLLAAHGGGLLISGPVQKTCQSSQDCEKGQRCGRGVCTASARRPSLVPDPVADGTICADRIVPPWQDVEPEAFPDRPPAVEIVAGYRFQR